MAQSSRNQNLSELAGSVPDKMEIVLHEYKKGKLKSGGSGKKVKDRRQAVAIAISEQDKANKGKY